LIILLLPLYFAVGFSQRIADFYVSWGFNPHSISCNSWTTLPNTQLLSNFPQTDYLMKRNTLIIATCICGAILSFGACGGGEKDSSETSTADTEAKTNIDGKAIYIKYCVLCHGEDGKRQTNGAKDITVSAMPLAERVALIKTGKNLMTPFEGILTFDEMEAVARYSMTLK
jgi:mono/diheme cytochrome c family protein